jgi:hypothetical protein
MSATSYNPNPTSNSTLHNTNPINRTMSNHTYGNAATNPDGEMKQAHMNGNGASAHSEAAGYQGSGGMVGRFITPGGNPIDNSNPAFPVFHRR